jgi:hypothetical protein
VLKVKKIKCEKGQAIFEFIVFLPFFLILLAILITMGGAINGSINQQKSTRGYFYHLVKNNSNLPPREDLDPLNGVISATGMYSIGWRDQSIGGTPIGPCYKILSFAMGGKSAAENCNDKINTAEQISSFIKVFSVYGVCSASYAVGGSGGLEFNHLVNSSISGDCSIR